MRKTLQNYKNTCKEVGTQLEFYAMMRSGQHAIINWIFGQISDPVYYRNDILCFKGSKARIDRGRWRAPNGAPEDGVFPYYAYNIEDISIENIDSIYKSYKDVLCKVRPKSKVKVIIIRDPFNMFASRYRFFDRINTLRRDSGRSLIKEAHNTNKNSLISWCGTNAFQRWKEYAREALGDTNFLGENKIVINYNHWFSSRSYRKSKSKELGLDFSDSKLNFVPGNGYGSSFDLRTMNGKAQDMGVLKRWLRLPNSGRFVTRFDDAELVNLSYRLWPNLTKRVVREKSFLSKKNARKVSLI